MAYKKSNEGLYFYNPNGTIRVFLPALESFQLTREKQKKS